MNELLNNLKAQANYTRTENGALTHKTTYNKVLDMFSHGGAMRYRDEDDIIHMFTIAYQENPTYALKCLFYLRNVRGGAGERRFFRICLKWLAMKEPDEVRNFIKYIATFGRYDDLFELFDTPCEKDMVRYIQHTIDWSDDHLIYKWMPSINASAKRTKMLGRRFADALHMTEREYRKMLSEGRKACHLVETLMSQNQWDQIAFDKLPSRAGLLYKNAFMRREETRARYAEFMSSPKAKVNAAVLNPVEIAHQIFTHDRWHAPTEVERNTWQRYWDNLKDYYNGREEPGIAVVDVSGSMFGQPLEAAVAMGAYIAERGKGPFQNHFITFSADPELVEFVGSDIYDKFHRASYANWGMNTNLEAVFDLLLQTGLQNHVPDSDMPKTLYIFSDMEFDEAFTEHGPTTYYSHNYMSQAHMDTLVEGKMREWKNYGYTAPRVIFWNLRSAHSNIPAIGPGFSYCSGFSMSALEGVLSGLDGIDMMLKMLDNSQYDMIVSVHEGEK